MKGEVSEAPLKPPSAHISYHTREMCGYCPTALNSILGRELVWNSPGLLPVSLCTYTLHMGNIRLGPETDDKHGGKVHPKHLVNKSSLVLIQRSYCNNLQDAAVREGRAPGPIYPTLSIYQTLTQ